MVFQREHAHLGAPTELCPFCPCSNGGVSLVSADGRIVCGNTIDHRLKISYHANLPEIRTKLFGNA